MWESIPCRKVIKAKLIYLYRILFEGANILVKLFLWCILVNFWLVLTSMKELQEWCILHTQTAYSEGRIGQHTFHFVLDADEEQSNLINRTHHSIFFVQKIIQMLSNLLSLFELF